MRGSWGLVFVLLGGCPGPDEVCNGLDDDGDGEIDEDAVDTAPLFVDSDGDGYGLGEAGTGCPVSGRVWEDGDCDDADDGIAPGAPERCNGVDDDCDGSVPADEGDEDEDGWLACASDCDDGDPLVGPDQPERCNGVDDDCDGSVPADELDADADGFRSCEGDCDDDDPEAAPGRPEDCDGVDDDCDGNVDWGHWVPADYATPQAALDEAPVGATVCVAVGTWDGPFAGTRGVSLVGESRAGTVLTSSTPGSTTLSLSGSEPSTLGTLTVTHAAPERLGQLVDLAGPVDVSELTLAGPACTGECLVRAGKVDAPSAEVRWEDVLVRDLTWTGATREPLGPGLTVEGPLSLRRIAFEDLTIRPSACGAYVRGAALFGPRASIEDLRIEGVDIDLPDCSDPGVVQVEGGLVLLVPTLHGFTVRDVNVRLLESESEVAVSVRGLVARLPGVDASGIDIEGVTLELGGQPRVDGGLLKLDGVVDGVRIDNVDAAAVRYASWSGGLIAATDGADLALSGLQVRGVEITDDGDGMVLAVPPSSRRTAVVTVEDVLIEDVTTNEGSLVWLAPGTVDATLRDVVIRDVAGGALIQGFHDGALSVEDLRVRRATLAGPVVELRGMPRTELGFVDVRDVSVRESSLIYASHGVTAHHWVLAGNDVVGPAPSALVEVRGGAFLLDFATLYANSIPEVAETSDTYLIRGPDGGGAGLSHVDLTGNGTDSRAAYLATEIGTVSYTNRFDNIPPDWVVVTSGYLLADIAEYVDVDGPDPDRWDLHLSSSSPLIDAGDPRCADADASVCDIGAYGGAAWPE